MTIELQPKASLIITDKMRFVQFHQVAIGCTDITGKEKNIPCYFHFILQSFKAESLQHFQCFLIECFGEFLVTLTNFEFVKKQDVCQSLTISQPAYRLQMGGDIIE